MSQLDTTSFITDNFLLHSKEAEILYHQYAKDMPIIDYHNHLSAKANCRKQTHCKILLMLG